MLARLRAARRRLLLARLLRAWAQALAVLAWVGALLLLTARLAPTLPLPAPWHAALALALTLAAGALIAWRGAPDLSAVARIYAKLILKGVESYLVFSPVVSRTSTYKDRPDPADCGKIQTPPITVPGTWEYLKTGDRIVQQSDGKYVRSEQWTGADTWERELYEEA